MITCEPMWRWMRRFLQIGCFVALCSGVPAGAQTLSSLGHTSEPAAMAVLGAGFLVIGFIRRRSSGD